MNPTPATVGVIRLLDQVRSGTASPEALLPLVYDDLCRLAGASLAKLPFGQTLQPPSLVDEAYLRVLEGKPRLYNDARHFFFAAARAMHDILVEQTRRKATLKRGGGKKRVDPDRLELATAAPTQDILALHDALDRLAHRDARKRQLVELRFFAGLTMEETARNMNLPLRTLEREWRFIRAFLHKEISGSE